MMSVSSIGQREEISSKCRRFSEMQEDGGGYVLHMYPVRYGEVKYLYLLMAKTYFQNASLTPLQHQ